VFGEANARPRGPDADARELLHLVAQRALGAERFEAVLAPRTPLGPNTTLYLELPAERLLAGEPVAQALARLRAFLRPDDLLCGWGRSRAICWFWRAPGRRRS